MSWSLQRNIVFLMMFSRTSITFIRCLQPTSRTRSMAPFRLIYVPSRPNVRPITTRRQISWFVDDDEYDYSFFMDSTYRQWTLEEDMQLWENRNLATPDLAALVGRGLRGVEMRLKKLKDVNHPAYQRLFANTQDTGGESLSTKVKLVPVTEVIRRIKWSLDPSEFSFLHTDRKDDSIVESGFNDPNESVTGKATLLIDAIPQHRIIAVKYRDRIVWDRHKRLDHVFSEGGINAVMESYEEWKEQQATNQELAKQKQQQLNDVLVKELGSARFEQLRGETSLLMAHTANPTVSTKLECEKYIAFSLNLFREAYRTIETGKSDVETLDILSEFVALLPEEKLRRALLHEISLRINKAHSTTELSPNRSLPDLDENDIEETFIRGSGPGGQKINKTSNRVLLIHKPTQLRVECQDTRSLQQNRKIARKRLRLKLDEYLNGSQSIERMKASKASNKKAKAKARSRKRQRMKEKANSESEDEHSPAK